MKTFNNLFELGLTDEQLKELDGRIEVAVVLGGMAAAVGLIIISTIL